MIEVIARGPVTVGNDTRIDKQSGRDTITGRVTISERLDVEVHLEFPQGYVNLEGYAPSYPHGFPIGEIFGRYADVSCENVTYHDDEWDVKMRGEWFDWVQQAHRYLTERPDKSLVSCLETFNSWPETDGGTIQQAIKKVEDRFRPGSTMPMGEMTDDQWGMLRDDLNSLDDRLAIPESYAE